MSDDKLLRELVEDIQRNAEPTKRGKIARMKANERRVHSEALEVQSLSEVEAEAERSRWYLPHTAQRRYEKLLTIDAKRAAEFWELAKVERKAEPTPGQLEAKRKLEHAFTTLERVLAGPQTLKRRI